MRRVIVLGGTGLFGRTIAQQLRRLAVPVHVASRRAGADLKLDADDPGLIRATIQPGDVVIDAAGPFHKRSMTLLEAAVGIGFDVIDINDNLGYAESVVALEPQIAAAGVRVVSSASSVSAVSAAVVQQSGVAEPTRVTAFLAPAIRHTANAGTALSLINSVGRPIRVYRDGRMQSAVGWTEPRRFPMPRPVGPVCGRLFESADSLYLPRIWPTLREVAMYVDTNVAGMISLLRLAAHSGFIRGLLQRGVRLGAALARRFGSPAGGIGYEIEDAAGRVVRYAVFAERNSYMTAVAPAVLAARAIIEDRFPTRGLVPPDRHVEPAELFAHLSSINIAITRLE